MRRKGETGAGYMARLMREAEAEFDALPAERTTDRLPERTKPGTRFTPPTPRGRGPRKMWASS